MIASEMTMGKICVYDKIIDAHDKDKIFIIMDRFEIDKGIVNFKIKDLSIRKDDGITRNSFDTLSSSFIDDVRLATREEFESRTHDDWKEEILPLFLLQESECYNELQMIMLCGALRNYLDYFGYNKTKLDKILMECDKEKVAIQYVDSKLFDLICDFATRRDVDACKLIENL